MTAIATRVDRTYETATFHPAAHSFTGTGTMIRFILRRNWIRLVVWFVVIVGLLAFVADYYQTLFSTQEALDDFAKVSNTPSIKALTGLAAVPNTMGGAVWTKIWMTCALALAFGAIFLITRNGRADEEAGRAELLRSKVLGIHAASLASAIVVSGLCVAIGIGMAAVSVALKLDPTGTGINGSLILGASTVGVAFVAIGIAMVCGQLTSTGRGANAFASVVLGVFYILRMVGDMNDSFVTWLSPIGWGEKMEPFGPDNWAPLALTLVAGVALIAVALVLEGRRDHMSGLIQDRPGPANAHKSLATSLGLGMRLQRSAIIGWTLTIIVSAMLFGSVVNAMTDLVTDSPEATKLTGGTGIEALISMLVMLVAMVITAFALQTAMTLRSEEASGILEPQLSGAMSRTRWALGRLVIPIVGSGILLFVGGLLLGTTYGASVNDSAQAMTLASACIAYWPAVMVLIGIAVALFGWFPRLTIPVTWTLLGFMWVLTLLGDALNLPTWFKDYMPFAATPYMPLEAMSWTPVIIMTALAVALIGIGLMGFRRRDIRIG